MVLYFYLVAFLVNLFCFFFSLKMGRQGIYTAIVNNLNIFINGINGINILLVVKIIIIMMIIIQEVQDKNNTK